jgi:ribonuclease HI
LKKLEEMNDACLLKLAWNLRNGENSFWCKVLAGKYDRENLKMDMVVAKPSDSSLWKKLVQLWPILSNMAMWVVGNGETVHAWDHCWLDKGMRVSDMHLNIPADMHHYKVVDLVDNNGDWRIEEFESWAPNAIVKKLRAIPPPHPNQGPDISVCPGANMGEFSVSYAYNELCSFHVDTSLNYWKKIWKLKVQERIRCFVWILHHNRLLTNSRLSMMHLGSEFCYHCGDVVETALHVLRDCPLAVGIWLNMVGLHYRDKFFNANLQQWLNLNMNAELGMGHMKNWAEFWASACHSLWYWRNKMTHDSGSVLPTRPWLEVLKRVHIYDVTANNNAVVHQHNNVIENIHWQPPSLGWIRLNTDGASKGEDIAGCGGVLRGNNGEWICGFSKGLGACSAYVAELWGVFEGLKLALSHGFLRVELHVDSKVVVNTISFAKGGSSTGWTLVQNIRRLLELDWEVKICHSYREANFCADALANLACDGGFTMILYEQCPAQVRSIYLADVVGVYTPRLVNR